ncbi:hypothetical protein F4859DRAFT_496023 [Xylaria cf. heliscus]|nr:hypothetical protein F4859DRAFT_496023 [Xylaria cf. heliscus]
MEDLGNYIDIILLPVADEDTDATPRTKPSQSIEFNKTPYQAEYGDQLISRAAIAGITHGTLAPGEDPATLLIFEFRFLSMRKGRRFTGCNINITFEDSEKQGDLCPEVWGVSPEGAFRLHKSLQQRSVTIAGNAMLQTGISGPGASLGTTWELKTLEDRQDWARLSGTRKELGRNNRDDAVVWAMEENSQDKSGIPTFLRAAVLLRRETEEPFSFLIKIRAQVDMGGFNLRTVFGKKKVERVSAVRIDSSIDPKTLKVPSLDAKLVDLTRMDELDLSTLADVAIATLL